MLLTRGRHLSRQFGPGSPYKAPTVTISEPVRSGRASHPDALDVLEDFQRDAAELPSLSPQDGDLSEQLSLLTTLDTLDTLDRESEV